MTSSAVLDRRERIGILWRADRKDAADRAHPLFEPLAERFAKAGVTAVPVRYSDEATSEVKNELLRLGAVLVWVDPISNGRDRRQLDGLLREVSARGVSAISCAAATHTSRRMVDSSTSPFRRATPKACCAAMSFEIAWRASGISS